MYFSLLNFIFFKKKLSSIGFTAQFDKKSNLELKSTQRCWSTFLPFYANRVNRKQFRHGYLTIGHGPNRFILIFDSIWFIHFDLVWFWFVANHDSPADHDYSTNQNQIESKIKGRWIVIHLFANHYLIRFRIKSESKWIANQAGPSPDSEY